MDIRFAQSPDATSFVRTNVTRRVLQLLLLASLISIAAQANATNRDVPTSYSTIQAAVNAADPGDSIILAAGTYIENITINKRVLLKGAGSGISTIESGVANSPVITINAGGDNATDRLVIQDVTVKGASGSSGHAGSGITLQPGVLGYLTFDNVTVVENSGTGIDINLFDLLTDIVIRNCTLSQNGGSGFRAPASSLGINGLDVSNSHFDRNAGGGFTAYSFTLTNWNIRNSTFNDNVGPNQPFTGGYGMYLEGHIVRDISIDCSEFSRNVGTDPNNNNVSSGLVLLPFVPGDTYSNISITHTQFNDNPFAGILVQPNLGTLMNGVVVECDAFERNGYGFEIFDGGLISGVSVHNSNFSGSTTAGLENDNAALINATSNWWGSASGPSGVGPGSGDAIINGGIGAVLFTPFRASASACPSACTPAPAIAIVKKTNGTDNDTAPGVYVPVPSTVNWTYLVTNTGNVPLTNIVVTDNQAVTVTCPLTTLGDGESMTCTASAAAVAGQYTNIGSVTGKPPTGPNVTASNPDNYFGQTPAIAIVKKTNGSDNNTAPGVYVPVGSTVTWTYNVTNTGNVTLNPVTVTDDKVGAITCPATSLAAGANMTCTKIGTALAGQYTNIGTATGKPPVGSNVTATNPDNYFGLMPLTLTCPANSGTANVAYSSAVLASGGVSPYSFMIASGSLPPGLSLNPATGAITGLPTTAGSYIFTVKVTDFTGATAFSSCGSVCVGGIKTWSFNTPAGVLGASQTYTVNGIPITAYGFSNAGAPKNLYGKNDGGIENGLGIAGTSADNEIDVNTFVQIDLNNMITAGATNGQMVVNSVQTGEKYNVYGSNTLGSIGTLLGSANRTLGNAAFAIPSFPTYRYVSVRATYADVLFSSVTFTLPSGCIITIAPAPSPCAASGTLTFSGSSATSGTAGNIRSFAVGSVNVHASAFSRIRSGGTWNTAYLGAYSGGLGVTDGSEGDGSSDRHKIDNIGGRDNYVLLEFSQPVVIDRAFLDVVGADSDMSLWIGTKTDPYNSHQTLSDALLSSFYTEENSTADVTPGSRWADLNVTAKTGNIVIIAALTSDTTPEDAFKLSKLELACPPPPMCSAGTFAFSGNFPTSGTAGNILTFVVNGVTAKVSAFSRADSGGAWAPGYLGLYSGGLGVTDTSEGDGSSDRHKVDNIGGRNNYVLFEFSAPVVVDKAYLDIIGADSDMSAWIGTKPDPISNHLTLTDALLTSLGTREDNTTTSTAARWADINAGNVVGNVLVIAAKPGDATLNDAFKISKLAITCR